jgi:hypothetical protein
LNRFNQTANHCLETIQILRQVQVGVKQKLNRFKRRAISSV